MTHPPMDRCPPHLGSPAQTALLMADNFVNCEIPAACRIYLHEHLDDLDFDVFKVPWFR